MPHSVSQLRFIREIDGREVWVAVGDDVEQVILLEDAGWSGLLARVLARPEDCWPERVYITRQDGDGLIGHEETRAFTAVPHTDAVDDFLWQLIDGLIDIRVQHPTMMQLPLRLTVEEAQQLQEMLGG